MKPSEDEHHLNVNFWDCENAKKKKGHCVRVRHAVSV